jgi:hypothetical protein
MGAEVKQIPLRLDRELYEELSRRSTIERKSIGHRAGSFGSHFDAVRVTKPQLRAAIKRIARGTLISSSSPRHTANAIAQETHGERDDRIRADLFGERGLNSRR